MVESTDVNDGDTLERDSFESESNDEFKYHAKSNKNAIFKWKPVFTLITCK